MKALIGAVAALTLTAGLAAAQQPPKIQVGTMARTSPVDGKEMFTSYCAACHGPDGKGTGPAAKALAKAPADLTRISARNNGTFPGVRVRRYIEGSDEIAAHGTRDMPMWGSLFRKMGSSDAAELRIESLAKYLESIQQK
ncbi:MAG: c-type cytochrome [Vicinamibacterales bacterium]